MNTITMNRTPEEQHNLEIHENLERWNRKPLLREVYTAFYRELARWVNREVRGEIVELGSGIGAIRGVIPDCVLTDIFANPWIDRVESAYRLSSADGSVSNLILFDVFHHLEYPGTALEEFKRVLVPGGRVILFDPAISLLGLVVYGPCHHEPIGLRRPITWTAPSGINLGELPYYAAQGNATRVFFSSPRPELANTWKLVRRRRYAALSYALSGGYRGPQCYPASMLPLLRGVDRVCDLLPWIFATRCLVVLERRPD